VNRKQMYIARLASANKIVKRMYTALTNVIELNCHFRAPCRNWYYIIGRQIILFLYSISVILAGLGGE
jgi:hypothetical protein